MVVISVVVLKIDELAVIMVDVDVAHKVLFLILVKVEEKDAPNGA